jgi:hypothetical protein
LHIWYDEKDSTTGRSCSVEGYNGDGAAVKRVVEWFVNSRVSRSARYRLGYVIRASRAEEMYWWRGSRPLRDLDLRDRDCRLGEIKAPERE